MSRSKSTFKILALTGIAAMVMTLVATGAASVEAKTVIKLGNVQPGTMVVNQGLNHYSDLVKERTGGEIDLQVFPASQLGTEQEILEGVKLGTIHMFEGSAGAAGRFLSELEAFAHPFIWRDLDHMLAVTRGAIGEEFNQKLIKTHGMRILDMGWLFGHRHLTTSNKAVRTPADMADLKIRVQPVKMYLDMIKAMGGNPTPVDFKELYMALQTGVVDGQENPIGIIYHSKFYEVQKYLSLTGHMTQNQVIIINEDFFKSLPKAQQDILATAARDAGDWQNAIVEKDAAELLTKLKAEGMTVIEPDIAAFRKATSQIYKDYEDKWGKGLFERIVDTK